MTEGIQTQAAEETTETQGTEAATDSRVRVSYNQDVPKMTLTVRFDKEVVELPAGEELFAQHPDVKDHLALVGLTTYLQRESSRQKDAEKIEAADKAYETLLNKGIEAFARKAGGGPRGPRKADKIAALAALKGATTAAVEKVLSTKTKEEQDAILNNKKVLAKLAKMNQGDEELDLSV